MAAPGVLATYSLRFTDSLVRMLFIPILPLFALELIAEATGVNSFTGLVIGSAPAPGGGFDLLAVAHLSSAEAGALHWKTPDGPRLRLLPLPYPMA